MTQERALEILKTGGNVFLTGEPGAGKTYVINQYIAWLEAAGLSVAVTASTGIAATHIGGMTIHAWSGIGARNTLTPQEMDQVTTREKVVKRMKKAKVLVIDEISMLDGTTLDTVNQVCKNIRQRSDAFGGLQVIFVGDFFQLPPVTRQGDVMRYAFESLAWQAANPLVCYLTEQYRQEDEMLLGLLSSIRKGQIEEDHYTLLNEQTEIAFPQIEPTRLYTHNADVDAMNAGKLKELAGTPHRFQMTAKGAKPLLEGLVRTCLSPELLELKEDAMVMCTKNNFEVGYVNGTLGRVVRFDFDDGYPVIKTSDDREIKIVPTSWEYIEDGKPRASIEQIPLRLAWAITVHKSQGMSLDAAEVDLSKAFVYGQGYVALSRVRSLDGLKVNGMHPNALQVDPKVIRQDGRFRDESQQAEETFEAMNEEELQRMHEQFVVACGGKVPTGEIVARGKAARQPEISTLDQTKELILAGKSIAQIAKERSMVATTIWGHVEKLTEQGALSRTDIDGLLPEGWDVTYPKIQTAMLKVGTEKLKPIYEELQETYDYDIIRIARLWHSLS